MSTLSKSTLSFAGLYIVFIISTIISGANCSSTSSSALRNNKHQIKNINNDNDRRQRYRRVTSKFVRSYDGSNKPISSMPIDEDDINFHHSNNQCKHILDNSNDDASSDHYSSLCSQQVHVTLLSETSIVIVYASFDYDMIESVVQYSLASSSEENVEKEEEEGGGGGGGGEKKHWHTVRNEYKYGETYSLLYDFSPNTIYPPMGKPSSTIKEMIDMQNTTGWAYYDDGDGDHNHPGSAYNKPYNMSYSSIRKGMGAYNNPANIYNSPIIHSVQLDDLIPGRKYYYKVNGDDRIMTFTMPPLYNHNNDTNRKQEKPSLVIGLTADLGQTAVSNVSMVELDKMDPNLILLAGDLSYADGWHKRWDTFGLLAERTFSKRPIMTCPGNHEVDSGEALVPYNTRYPMPHRQSKSTSNTYWSMDVGDLLHVISLNSYGFSTTPNMMMSENNDYFFKNNMQYRWLERDLQAVNRTKTPWIIVMMHVPFYNSNTNHQVEDKLYRQPIEDLFYKYGVDIVVSGHVHSYERSTSVYNGTVDACGTTYLNLGDGGNREGAVTPWTKNQPSWSMFREASFGVGKLEIYNNTLALFTWKRHACFAPGNSYEYNINFDEKRCITPDDNSGDAMTHVDAVHLIRPDSSRCHNKHYGTTKDSEDSTTMQPPPDNTNDNTDTINIEQRNDENDKNRSDRLPTGQGYHHHRFYVNSFISILIIGSAFLLGIALGNGYGCTAAGDASTGGKRRFFFGQMPPTLLKRLSSEYIELKDDNK